MESKLYVGNLSYNVTEEQLRELFSQAGTIKEIAMITDRDTNRSQGQTLCLSSIQWRTM